MFVTKPQRTNCIEPTRWSVPFLAVHIAPASRRTSMAEVPVARAAHHRQKVTSAEKIGLQESH
jgi:hypothetical protein